MAHPKIILGRSWYVDVSINCRSKRVRLERWPSYSRFSVSVPPAMDAPVPVDLRSEWF